MVLVDQATLDQLKPWVEQQLAPIAEADVDVLGEYVLALLKHDLPINELRKMCEEQLQDFLHDNAKPFVSSLMDALEYASGYDPNQSSGAAISGNPSVSTASTSGISNNGSAGENQFHGQEQFRRNFRTNRDRDLGVATGEYEGSNDIPQRIPQGPRNSLPQAPRQGHHRQGFSQGVAQNPSYYDQGIPVDGVSRGYDQGGQLGGQYDPSQPTNYPYPMMPGIPQGMDGSFIPQAQFLGAAPVPNKQGFVPPFNLGPQSQMIGFPQQQSGGNGRGGGWRKNKNGRFRINNNNTSQDRNSSNGGGSNFTSPLAGKKVENDYSSTKLIVEKLPDDKFNESSVREYFSKFGTITDLTLNNGHKVVELEYEAHDQARAAYESPEAIFGNRFVRVYWRKQKQDTGDPNSVVTPAIDVEAVRRIQMAKQREFEEKKAKRLEYESKMQKVLEMKTQILKEQQRILLQQSAAAGGNSNSTEALKLQLEALKAEAESLGISSEHNNTTVTRGRGGYRGGGYHPYASRGRGGGFGAAARGGRGGFGSLPRERYSLDLRPKSVLVSPVPADKEEALRSHLLSVGEYDSVRRSPTTEGFIVDFKDRKSAEVFFKDNNIPEVGSVEMQWERSNSKLASPSPQPDAMDTN